MITASLPDQLEVLLPLGRHRGASHWLLLWTAVVISTPLYLQANAPLRAHLSSIQLGEATVTPLLMLTFVYGLALGPFLHVIFDGCSDSGVPVAPFSRRKFQLGMYRTYSNRWRWDPSELLFVALVLGACALLWRIRGASAFVSW